jgi:hypothetical protein
MQGEVDLNALGEETAGRFPLSCHFTSAVFEILVMIEQLRTLS